MMIIKDSAVNPVHIYENVIFTALVCSELHSAIGVVSRALFHL